MHRCFSLDGWPQIEVKKSSARRRSQPRPNFNLQKGKSSHEAILKKSPRFESPWFYSLPEELKRSATGRARSEFANRARDQSSTGDAHPTYKTVVCRALRRLRSNPRIRGEGWSAELETAHCIQAGGNCFRKSINKPIFVLRRADNKCGGEHWLLLRENYWSPRGDDRFRRRAVQPCTARLSHVRMKKLFFRIIRYLQSIWHFDRATFKSLF